MLGKMNGFTDAQIIEIRHGHASFDGKLNALARLTNGITQNRGHVDQALVDAFFAAGWTKENLVDAIVIIGDKTVSNYLHSTTKIPVDFPAAPALD
ncbi:MAG TPA: carboxymuconolactone decarboxylase family protein, partial [Burkholderiaceae bacterium]|nr:carboxymuconolactone decarboxylase family protein [Burkholderiaceae bacterium]